MEVEQYGYHYGHTIDLDPVMPATQFRVTDEAGTYLCAARALVFEGSVLAYNPTRDEVEWVPACGVTNDREEKSAMALVNYVPCISQEAAHIAGLGTRRLMSWPNDSSSEEGEEEDEWEEDEQEEEEDEHEEAEGQGEAGFELPSSGAALKEGKMEQEAKPRR